MIYWQLCKKFKFDHTFKWYMNKTEPVLEKYIHKIFSDFETQRDHRSPAIRPDLVIITIKKITFCIVDFPVPAGNRVKTK